MIDYCLFGHMVAWLFLAIAAVLIGGYCYFTIAEYVWKYKHKRWCKSGHPEAMVK